MRTFPIAVLVVAAALVAGGPGRADAQKRSRDLIKHDEIIASVREDQDLYSAIQRLRPHFLQNPGRSAQNMSITNPIRVYVGRAEQPGFDFLRSQMAWDVEEVRYLSPSEAGGRFGDRANGGAIVVTLVKVKAEKMAPPKDTLARF